MKVPSEPLSLEVLMQHLQSIEKTLAELEAFQFIYIYVVQGHSSSPVLLESLVNLSLHS